MRAILLPCVRVSGTLCRPGVEQCGGCAVGLFPRKLSIQSSIAPPLGQLPVNLLCLTCYMTHALHVLGNLRSIGAYQGYTRPRHVRYSECGRPLTVSVTGVHGIKTGKHIESIENGWNASTDGKSLKPRRGRGGWVGRDSGERARARRDNMSLIFESSRLQAFRWRNERKE